MSLFVLLTRLTGSCKQQLRNEPEILEEICKKLEGCSQGQFPQLATLGQYDFVNIVEAKNEETVYRLSLELNSRGDLETIVMPAIPLKKYLEEVKKMKNSE